MRLKYNVDFKELEKYLPVKDSYSLTLYHGLETGKKKSLQCRFHDRRIYFTNGEFTKGKQVLEEFKKKGWLDD